MLKGTHLVGFGGGGNVPPSISYAGITKSTAAQNHTLAGVALGAEDPTRRIVFAVITTNSVAFRTATVTVDGVSPTSHVSVQAGSGFNGGRIEFFSILKPTGTTATFQINTSGTNTHVTLFVWNAINESSASPFATGTDSGMSGNQVDLTLNVPANGWIVGCASLFGGSTNPTGNTWTGITETADDVVGTTVARAGAANESFLAAQTGRNIICVVAGPTVGQSGELAAMSWG